MYDELSNFEKTFALEGILMKKPNANKYLFSAIVGLNTFIFECDGDSIYNEKFIYLSPAVYKSSDKRGQRPKLIDVQARYNVSPFVTNAYIYMSNRNVTVHNVFSNDVSDELPYMYTSEIVAFSWNGEPCHKYILESPVRSFFVDDDDRVLYGVSVDSDGYDYILKYQLK